jgi:hypothetical protein
VNFDLDMLKQEILDYLAAEGFAVFRGMPDSLDDDEAILWDTKAYPEFPSFLNVAKMAGASLIIFAHRTLEMEEIDEALEQLEDCDFDRDEKRTVERSLKELRDVAGSTCSIELAFDHQGRLHVFDLTTEWYDTFLELTDLLMTAPIPEEDEDEDEANGSFGGYFSKN